MKAQKSSLRSEPSIIETLWPGRDFKASGKSLYFSSPSTSSWPIMCSLPGLHVAGIGEDRLATAVSLIAESLGVLAEILFAVLIAKNLRRVPDFANVDPALQFGETLHVIAVGMREYEKRQVGSSASLRQGFDQVIDDRPFLLIGVLGFFEMPNIDLYGDVARFHNEGGGITRANRPKNGRFLSRKLEFAHLNRELLG